MLSQRRKAIRISSSGYSAGNQVWAITYNYSYGTKNQSKFISLRSCRRTGRCAGSLKAAIRNSWRRMKRSARLSTRKSACPALRKSRSSARRATFAFSSKRRVPGLSLAAAEKVLDELNMAIANAVRKVRKTKTPIPLTVNIEELKRSEISAVYTAQQIGMGSREVVCRSAGR